MSTALRRHLSSRVVDVRRRALDARADPGDGDGDRGFVLLEEIVSITLLMIVMAALATFFLTVTQSTTYERARQSAVQLANTQMDAVNAVNAGDLYLGRAQLPVQNQFSSAPPTVAAALQTTQAAWDTNVPVSALTLPMSTTTVANKITYTITNYLGNCWVPTSSLIGTDCTTTAAAIAAGTPYVRAVVSVTWPGTHCPQVNGAGLCTYVTSSLISAAGDPTFNLCTLGAACGPAAPQVVNPGNQFSVVNTAVSVQLALTPNTGVAPTTWSICWAVTASNPCGPLPSWLSLNVSTGLLTGTAPSTPAAPVSVVVTATDSFARTAQTTFTWAVVLPPTITGLVTPYTATAGLAIPSQTLPYTCPTSSCTYSLTGAPSGITLATSSAGTGAASQTVMNTSGNLYLVGTVATTAAVSTTAYPNDVASQKASNYWRLDETSGTTGVDSIGGNNLIEQVGVTHGAAGGIATNSDYASIFDGAADGSASTTTAVTGPTTFSESIWFKTTTTSGGKLLGFGNVATGLSNTYDRQIVMDNAGHLDFGVYSGGTNVVATSNTYNDGKWHQAVGTLSPTGGMVFYVDGVNVGSNAAITIPQASTGYWRLGGDNVAGWTPQPSSYYFAGALDDASIYPSALTATQVQQQYTDSQGTAYTVAATPKDLITGTVGVVNQAAWTVVPPLPPTITGLTNPVVAIAGATISNQTLPYTCATSNCTYTLTGAPSGVGLALLPGGIGRPSQQVLNASGTLYLVGTVSATAATTSYTVTVLPRDATLAVNGPIATAAWTVVGATVTGLANPLSTTVGASIASQTLPYTCPSGACSFTLTGAPAGTGLDTDNVGPVSNVATVTGATSGSIYLRGTVGPVTPGSYSLLLTPTDTLNSATGPAVQAAWTVYAAPTVTGLTAPLKTSVGATIADDNLAYTCPTANCTFAVSGAPSGIGIAPDTNTAPTPSVTVTATSGTLYLRGTISSAATLGSSYTPTVTPTDNLTSVAGAPASSGWTLVTPMSVGSPGTISGGAGTSISQPITYTCPQGNCTITISGDPTGIGMSTVQNTAAPANSVNTVTVSGSGTAYAQGKTSTGTSSVGTFSVVATIADAAASTVTSATGTWTITPTVVLSVSGLLPLTTTAGAVIGVQPLAYSCPTGSCTYTLANAPAGVGLATDPTAGSPATFVTASGTGTIYLRGTVTASTPTSLTYPADVRTQNATDYWRLGETVSGTGADSVGSLPLTEQAGVQPVAPGAIAGSIDGAASFDGNPADGSASTTTPVSLFLPASYSESVWFQTTTTSGGKLLGLETTVSGTGGSSDRQLYLDNAGHVDFGMRNFFLGTPQSVASPGTYNDGQWHQAVATVAFLGAGTTLYVDGVKVASNTSANSPYAQNAGYWRLGGGSLSGWPNQPTSNYFAGNLDEAAIYQGVALSAGQVQTQYTDASAATYSLTVTPASGGTNGTATAATWTVYPQPTVIGLATPFVTAVGSIISNRPLPYTCPTASCTYTLAGTPDGLGLSTATTGGTSPSVTVGASTGTIYLRGTVSSSAAASSYPVTVTPADIPSGVVGTPNAATWTVRATPGTNAYASDVNGPASNYWRLGEVSGSTGADSAGSLPLTELAGVGHNAPGAILTNPINGASTFDGSPADGSASTGTAYGAPTTNLSVSIWFKTTTTTGGKLIGFESSQTGQGGNYDRQLYLDNAGRINFGVCPIMGCPAVVTSTGSYNDGQWHEAVGTLSASAGMALYVDGVSIGVNSTATAASYFSGYWRLGGGNVFNWPNQPSSYYFAGTLDEAAVYPSVLTLAQVQQQYLDSGRTP